MYNVTGGRYTKFTGTFGALKAIAELHLEYADGTAEVIGTDDRWQISPGPITFSCVLRRRRLRCPLAAKVVAGGDRQRARRSTERHLLRRAADHGPLRSSDQSTYKR